VIDALVTRLRPFMLVEEKCYFPYILKRLRPHLRVEGGPLTFDELGAKWAATLKNTTAPVPAGTTLPNVVPGYTATALREGQMTLTFDNEVLTGREVVELLQYGELVHVVRVKEKKLLRIRESDMEPGFQVAVIAVIASLGYLIDVLRLYAEIFVKGLPAEIIESIEAIP
jgi:hypothetical protein